MSRSDKTTWLFSSSPSAGDALEVLERLNPNAEGEKRDDNGKGERALVEVSPGSAAGCCSLVNALEVANHSPMHEWTRPH